MDKSNIKDLRIQPNDQSVDVAFNVMSTGDVEAETATAVGKFMDKVRMSTFIFIYAKSFQNKQSRWSIKTMIFEHLL